jgi:uncharacterized protein (DUF2236 family)
VSLHNLPESGADVRGLTMKAVSQMLDEEQELAANAPEPLGPDSLTWKYLGAWRGLLAALWAGSTEHYAPDV